MPLRSLAAGALAAALALAACSDSTGPGVRRIALDQDVSGRIDSPGETAECLLDIAPDTWFTIRLGVPGNMPIRARLFANDAEVISFAGGFDDEDGEPAWMAPRLAAAGTRYRIRIEAEEQSDGGPFTLFVTEADVEPESRPAALEIGELVEGETIAHPADVDDYYLDGTAGEELNIFLQSTNFATSGGLRGWIVSLENGAPVIHPGFFGAAPASGGLSDLAHGRITLPQTGRYRIRIYGAVHAEEGQFTGGYRLLLYPIDRAPESVPAALVAGDTLEGESIDDVGDIDELVLSGAPGSEWVLFAEAGGAAPHAIVATVELPLDDAVATDAAGGATLLGNPSPRFVMPAGGSVSVTVEGERSGDGRYRGPYRLYAHLVDPAPEPGDAAFAFDVPRAGAIDVVGDVDEWVVDVPDDTLVHVSLARPAGTSGGPVRVELRDAAGVARAELSTYSPTTMPGDAAQAHSQRFVLPAGRYLLRVSGATAAPGGFAGAYAVTVRRVRSLPESVPQSIAVGAVVAGESLSPASDLDVFHLAGSEADTVAVVLSADGAPVDAELSLFVPGVGTVASARLDPSAGATGSRELGRLVLPASGEPVELRVSAPWAGGDPAQGGPYRLAVERISTAPEGRAASLAIGEVATEALGRPGDIDDFVYAGTPGDTVVAIFRWTTPGAPEDAGRLRVMGTTPGSVATYADGWSRPRATEHVVVPASGLLRLRVAEQHGCAIGGCAYSPSPTGDYTLELRAVSRGPETLDAAASVGDTLRGETVGFPGDVDEFTFAGTAGERIEVGFTIPPDADIVPSLVLHLVSPVTSTVVGTLTAASIVQELEDNALRGVVLAETGRWTIVVRGADASEWGPYLVRIVADP